MKHFIYKQPDHTVSGAKTGRMSFFNLFSIPAPLLRHQVKGQQPFMV
jgi:hypothetical protein